MYGTMDADVYSITNLQNDQFCRSNIICEKDFNVISTFDVLAKEKDYEMVKSNPDEVCQRFSAC